MNDNLADMLCSECSRLVGEQVYGTAPRADVWLLLEYAGAHGREALADSTLSEPVKAQFAVWKAGLPQMKALLIRQAGRKRDAGYTFIVAVTQTDAPALVRLTLAAYDDVLALDVPGMVAAAQHTDSAPLYLVCTNGRRDAACSKYGTPVYNALVEQGVEVWQSSHFGGHRFAGTVVRLPHGDVYGHLDADDAAELVGAHADGGVWLKRWRGWAGRDGAANAAEYYLGAALGVNRRGALRLEAVERTGDEAWAVTFAVDGVRHCVEVARMLSAWTSIESTGETPRPLKQWRLVGITTPS